MFLDLDFAKKVFCVLADDQNQVFHDNGLLYWFIYVFYLELYPAWPLETLANPFRVITESF